MGLLQQRLCFGQRSCTLGGLEEGKAAPPFPVPLLRFFTTVCHSDMASGQSGRDAQKGEQARGRSQSQSRHRESRWRLSQKTHTHTPLTPARTRSRPHPHPHARPHAAEEREREKRQKGGEDIERERERKRRETDSKDAASAAPHPARGQKTSHKNQSSLPAIVGTRATGILRCMKFRK